MVNEEMLVRAEGPIVRHLHAVLLGDRYLETGDLPPESDDLSPAERSDDDDRASRKSSRAVRATTRARPRR